MTNTATTYTNPFAEIIENSIKLAVGRSMRVWEHSPFHDLLELSNDERGYWGEDLLCNLLYYYFPGLPITWDKNSNTGNLNGIYDILINAKRTEVKTAMEGTTTKTFQHENIYAAKVWDFLMLIDIVPTGIFFTVETPESMEQVFLNFQHPVWKKKGTLRKGQTDKWKFDHSHASLKRTMAHGSTCFAEYLNEDDAAKFVNLIEKYFIN
jgi:hypothetical protein